MTFSATACSQSPVTPAIVLRFACCWLADSTPPLAFSIRYRTHVTVLLSTSTAYDIICHCLQSIGGNTGHCFAHCIHAANCINSNSRIFYAFLARRHSFVLIFKGSMTFSATACSQSPVTPAIVLRIAFLHLTASTPTLGYSTHSSPDVTVLFPSSKDL